MAVLVQPLARGDKLAVARSLDDGDFLVEERRAGEPEWGDVVARTVGAEDPLARVLAQIERLLGGPVDVELSLEGDRPTILQARPRAHAPLALAWDGLPGDWRLDAEHNPEPLS